MHDRDTDVNAGSRDGPGTRLGARPGTSLGTLLDSLFAADGRAHWALWLAAGIASAAIVSVGVPVHIVVYGLTGGAIAIAAIASVLQGASLVLLLARPMLAVWLHVAATLVLAVVTLPAIGWSQATGVLPWPLSVVSMIALVLLLVGLAVRRRAGLAIATTVAVLLPLTIVAVVLAPLGLAPGSTLAVLATTAGVAGMTNILATVVMQLALARGEVRAARDEAAEIDERRRWALERARIAREMHDVVAHSMSLVHMRATSAKYRIDGIGDEVADEFDGIAQQARTALGEMRGLLGVLRDETDRLDAPQPVLADLPRLIESARDAGIEVDATLPSPMPEAPAGVQLALYRVAQEAFSNVTRHAHGAPTSVQLDVSAEELVLQIRNAAPTGPVAVPIDGGGHGIRGMMERMASVDGHLEHGPTPDGGYVVTVRAPRRPRAAA